MNYPKSLFLFLFAIIFFSCKQSSPISEEPETVSVDTTLNKNDRFFVDLKKSEKEAHIEKASHIEEVLNKLASHKQFNGTVLVAEKGKVIYKGAIGKADYANSTNLDINTSFHLASVSKQFTAMGIMMLEEEGKLNYYDTINQYLPDFPYTGITIENLLNHTSGVPDISEYIPQFLGVWDTCKIAENEDVLYMLSTMKPGIKFYPGRRFSYSNTGYILLAIIIEKVSGSSYKDFMNERIFKPLNMNHSFVYDYSNLNYCPPRARAYSLYKYTYVPFEDDIRNGLLGEKGIYSSVVDLFKWDQALYTEKLVSKETITKAFSRGHLANGKLINYGLGWRMPPKENDLVYHFGFWKGSRASIIRILDDQYTIIILNNTSSRKLKYISRQIISILYDEREDKPIF
jgi:CubicO group peptidase (beta-lactamase class C family)